MGVLVSALILLYFGVTAVVRFSKERDKTANALVDALSLWLSAAVYGLVAFSASFAIYSGKEIYAFSLMLYTFLISSVGLWMLSTAVRSLAGDRGLFASNALRLGMPFFVVYTFLFYEDMKSWFHIATSN